MKLAVCIMGQNCEETIGMCLESVSKADTIIYLDGGSTDETEHIAHPYLVDKGVGLSNEYDQEDKQMNGKQRNIYLDYLKKEHMGEWCLALDADEVLEDFGIEKIKQTLENVKEPLLLSPTMHHFVGDLGHEDATRQIHYVPNRLFKITDKLSYPEVEHPVLQGEKQGAIQIELWHFRECLGVFQTQRKFESNMLKSNMHSELQLRQWQRDMLFGNYPRKRVHYDKLPYAIRRRFKI